MRFILLPLLALCAIPALARGVQACDLDGQPVNPNNGATTAGKSGLMRCRDGEGGPLLREQELKNGVFMGAVRYYKDDVLQRDYSINERGNKDGRSREYAATAGAKNQLLVEETYRNSSTVGLARRWHANGQLKRLSFHGDDGREQAVAEFTQQGKLSELRCAAQAQLGPDADDATWCGHNGARPATVTLYAEDGKVQGTLVHERGERRKSEDLWGNGKPSRQIETNAEGGVERSFSEAGVKRRERQWAWVGPESQKRRVTTLDREYHASGTLVREQQWKATDRGGELQLDQQWYLNGQLKEKRAYQSIDGKAVMHETRFHDNGRMSSEGDWAAAGRYQNQPLGVHKHYDSEGRMFLERHHDAQGRVTREREFDESGKLKRDDELFEDGSRKAFSKP